MNENMKGAVWAVVIMLPVLFGVGWFADIVTRAGVGAIVISNGGKITPELMEPILPRMVWGLLAMWVVVSAIVLGMAKMGLGAPHHMTMPEPPPYRKEQ